MDFSHLIEVYLIICILLLMWVYFLYPALVIILSKVIRKPIKIDKQYAPHISICISAYNEEDCIEASIRSIFASDYDLSKIRVIVGSDGSIDATNKILSKLTEEYPNLTVLEFPRSGKNYVLNEISKLAQGELIFYMDADCKLQKNSIREAVKYFGDEKVGVVICKMKLAPKDGKSKESIGDKSYISYEDLIRKGETLIYSTSSSEGLFYGVRKENYEPLPNSYILDDCYLPFLNGANGNRVVFAEDVEAYDLRGKSLKKELARRIRMTSASLPTLLAVKKLILPSFSWYYFSLFSHRILRWFSGVFFFSLLLVFFIPNSILYYPLGMTLLLFYVLAFIGLILDRFSINIPVFAIPAYFLVGNIGLFVGIVKALFGKSSSKWEK